MTNSILLHEVSPDLLKEIIQVTVKNELENFSKSLPENSSDELLTRQETCDLLKIDSSTLWHWTNKGKVTCYGIANRRYYKRSEIMDCLTQLKTIHDQSK
ncbi:MULTISPECIES: helix-turn-helix domain-containing protein [Chryseobacterium]|uniref:Helix-turn-helix domain-containing protein n=1 Tax=Chryseobacterium geocarposphaerae TaxID=1416776 RepID=A0ABU1LGK2_9FLAO|nr:MULTISPECIES: helix-turn-helix domain-containing protein [Chryseobacterium]MDR6405861.1 hypothetical protein [Chryseobacterium geocarposphaerae]MDR6698975.1 hypothetical protein [Chryseobacterium ginsenosidimutans]